MHFIIKKVINYLPNPYIRGIKVLTLLISLNCKRAIISINLCPRIGRPGKKQKDKLQII